MEAILELPQVEYSASDIRKILQQLFPQRRLVLSQFTFFNQVGVAKPTGETFRRGRRCYRLEDILSIATVLALKEEGIPLKNINSVPPMIQTRAGEIFSVGSQCWLAGFGGTISLRLPGDEGEDPVIQSFLSTQTESMLFWSYDVGLLATQLRTVAFELQEREVRRAA